MGQGHGSVVGLNGHQGCMKAFEAIWINAEVALAEARGRIEGDGSGLALRLKVDHHVIGETPERRDGDAVGEPFVRLSDVFMHASQTVVV